MGRPIVKWETLAGKKYQGEVIEVDSNVLICKLSDGTKKAVEMDKVELVER